MVRVIQITYPFTFDFFSSYIPLLSLQRSFPSLHMSLYCRLTRGGFPDGFLWLCSPPPGSGVPSIRQWISRSHIRYTLLLAAGERVTLTTLFLGSCRNRAGVKGQSATSSCMGFLQSYFRLPRYQRVVLGLAGVALGLYGPTLMSYVFLEGAAEQQKTDVNKSAHKS